MMGLQKTKPLEEKAIEAKLLALITEQSALEKKAAELRAEDPGNRLVTLNAERAALEEQLRTARIRREQQEQARVVRGIADRLGTETATFADSGATSSERAAIG
jgi:hypothetical protein